MQPTLADSLNIILPALATELATSTSLSYLQKLAKLSAPIPRAGFEIRLNRENHQVDLQQGIFYQDDQPKILANHLSALASYNHEFKQPVWSRIYQFCEVWSSPNSCIKNISEIWLEFDITDSADQQLTPSIFLGIKNCNLLESEETFHVVKSALELLWKEPISDSLFSNLYRCFTACVKPAYISHVGIMLSRQGEVLRINVTKLSVYQIATYLQQIGYTQAPDEIERLVNELLDIFDDVRLCLDVGTKIYPQIGLECFFEQQSGLDPRWLPFLDDLVAKELCTPKKRDALIAWVGYTTPSNSKEPWASHLIAESLLQPPESLSILDRRLSHIKLTYKPECSLEAKAYIGFVHQCLKNESIKNKTQSQTFINSQNENLPFPYTSDELNQYRLNQAIDAAIQFILNSANQKGWWCDFDIDSRKKRSDEWVTAYVGTVLASLPHEMAKQAAHHAWRLLLSRCQSSPGWGYNGFAPPDADSTAWTLRLATALGEIKSQRAQAASQFLAQHQLSSGGVVCYLEKELAFNTNANSSSLKGWCSVHTCVTAAVAVLEEIKAPSIEFLRNTQLENGSWKAYWWYDHEYATALAVEALAMDNYQRHYQQVQLAIDWAVSRISSSGAVYSRQYGDNSAFATAWCVRTLALAKEKQYLSTKLDQAVNWLMNTQKADGSWTSSALMRFPDPADILEPDSSSSPIIPDNKRIFTTATVLAALSRVQLAGKSDRMRITD
ncbi:prenyltransferase/squalene oxidase repeat-containing protein [Nostoc sp. UHCC 0251]|uniref:prenyltransferase/squalene oxidase repeat-containing protein n=1 Tax=Nostoc sp. UHCC 0251 TaxID=3110240 RepID=UPI002B1F1A9A|nr:prenyltransferase/squalene oxidase repeat-containing protein [Nostoc sp. UHCC 0251]MEA5622969.1 prenyltransferase/squalene oxidase repeat-containing protein [Nostoc sp. UHCC 0251]